MKIVLPSKSGALAPMGVAALLASSCLTAAPARAADAAATGGQTAVAEIIVTAEKRSENIQ
ncbi:MAG TPA: hypothetical protein VG166_06485, partial [Caulobacteraceae bacterium]|nr:hypothetical protein [Caulobacteraceae bacterium]